MFANADDYVLCSISTLAKNIPVSNGTAMPPQNRYIHRSIIINKRLSIKAIGNAITPQAIAKTKANRTASLC